MSGQMTFAEERGLSRRHKQTKRERFLTEMEAVVPWAQLVVLIEPHYPKGGIWGYHGPTCAALRVLRSGWSAMWPMICFLTASICLSIAARIASMDGLAANSAAFSRLFSMFCSPSRSSRRWTRACKVTISSAGGVQVAGWCIWQYRAISQASALSVLARVSSVLPKAWIWVRLTTLTKSF